MKYKEFKEILDKNALVISRFGLIEKIAFDATKYAGIINIEENLYKKFNKSITTASVNALKEVVKFYFAENNYEILGNKFKTRDFLKNKDEVLNVDIFLKKENTYFLIEQKAKDESNFYKNTRFLNKFEEKIDFVLENILNETEILKSFFYFVDPTMKKNTIFYKDTLKRISTNREIKTFLFYGEELFNYLQIPQVWEEITSHLTRWHFELEDIPNLNFDLNSKNSCEYISTIKTSVLIKFFNNENEDYNEKIWSEIMPIFFPAGETIELLIKDFETSKHKARNILAKTIKEKFSSNYKS